MELKFAKAAGCEYVCLFQSYLYGIEILFLNKMYFYYFLFQSYLYGIEMSSPSPHHGSVYCFNRTFMELKSVYIIRYGNKFIWFQSYLYGIEIASRYVQRLAMDVSIVPLWN